jgi:hypothetical protein
MYVNFTSEISITRVQSRDKRVRTLHSFLAPDRREPARSFKDASAKPIDVLTDRDAPRPMMFSRTRVRIGLFKRQNLELAGEPTSRRTLNHHQPDCT